MAVIRDGDDPRILKGYVNGDAKKVGFTWLYFGARRALSGDGSGKEREGCSSSGAANEVAAPLSEKTSSAAQPASLARKASSDSCRDRKLTRQDQVCRLGPVRNHVSGDQHRLRKRIAQADPSRFLQDDGRLDHSQTTTADILPDRQAKGAKFGERRDGAARTRAAERGPDAVSEAFLFLGILEVHFPALFSPLGRPRTRSAMMLR